MSPSKCPRCGADIPEPGMPSTVDIGTQAREPNAHERQQRVECPSCGTHLERMQDPGLGHDWRIARDTE